MDLRQIKPFLFKPLFGGMRFLNRIVRIFRTRRSNSVLLLQLHFIGDTILVTPAIALLKKAMPDYKLHIMVGNKAGPVVAHNPHIDRVYTDRTGHTGINSPLLFLRKMIANLGSLVSMWKENYDFVIDYSGYFDSAFIANSIGAKKLIGMSVNPALAHAYDSFHYIDCKDQKRLGANYLDLLSCLGISYSKEDCRYQIFCTESDTRAAEKITHDARGVRISIAPFAGWESKEWPLDRIVSLCNRLSELPATLFLLGDTGSAPVLEPYLNKLNAPAINCVGKTTLMESAAVIAASDLFIGVDSAMSYIAAAFKKPSVLIFGSTNPAFHWENDPGRLIILYKKQSCSCLPDQLCCGDNTIVYKCPRDRQCMRAVSVDEVFSSACQLMTGERLNGIQTPA
jgi:ADP-heptose:LPS heptosyltransferase